MLTVYLTSVKVARRTPELEVLVRVSHHTAGSVFVA